MGLSCKHLNVSYMYATHYLGILALVCECMRHTHTQFAAELGGNSFLYGV